MTVVPAFSASTITSHTYEAFDAKYPPSLFTNAIDQAIYEATGLIYPREESLALHADGKTMRFALPSEFTMVDKVEFRSSVTALSLHACDTVWDETTGSLYSSDLTIAIDSEDKKQGTASLKLSRATSLTIGSARRLIQSDTIPVSNLARYDFVEFWAKATRTVPDDALFLALHSSAIADSDPTVTLEELEFALMTTTDLWTYQRLAPLDPKALSPTRPILVMAVSVSGLARARR